MSEQLHYLDLGEAARRIRAGSLSPVALVRAHLDRIVALNPRLHAYITVTADAALAQARAAEVEIAGGTYRGPLHGIPLGHKDIVCTRGVRTTAHSRLLANWIPDEDAPVYARLTAAGAVSLGKTSLHEFAYGVPGADEAFPAARNPWNTAHAPGSSSSGSGAAVAAGLAMGAIGTDTGGSIRHPAAVCGIVGMKATYGRVPIRGILPLAASMDHAGPMTRTVRDNALMLQAMSGHDPLDLTSVERPVPDFSALIGTSLKGLRAGIPQRWLAGVRHDPEVLAAFGHAQAVLSELGVIFRPIEIPGLDDANDFGTVILTYEAYQHHKAKLAAHPEQYGEAFRNRVLAAARYSHADYAAAQARRTQLRESCVTLLNRDLDLIVTPGREAPAPTMAELTGSPLLIRGLAHRIYNLTGQPALVMPMGLSSSGLPLGLQIAAGHWREDVIYQVAAAYESAGGWNTRHPPL